MSSTKQQDQCDIFQNGNNLAESQYKHVRRYIIKDRVNGNCRKEPYLAESMCYFVVVSEIKTRICTSILSYARPLRHA